MSALLHTLKTKDDTLVIIHENSYYASHPLSTLKVNIPTPFLIYYFKWICHLAVGIHLSFISYCITLLFIKVFIDLDGHSGHLYGLFPLDDACFEPLVAVSILIDSLEIIVYSVFLIFPE